MYIIRGKLEGLATILFNSPKAVIDEIDSGVRKTRSREENIQLAKQRAEIDTESGHICIDNWNLKACAMAGAAKIGLKVGSKALKSKMQASMFGDTERFLFNRKKPDFIHEKFGRVPPRTGAGVLIRRPALNPGWQLEFSFQVWDDTIPAETIKQALDSAGVNIGLGSWRPHYGRFMVKEFEVVKNGN